jgi:hypothetical protein
MICLVGLSALGCAPPSFSHDGSNKFLSRMSMQEFPEPEYDYDEENKDEVGAAADK